MRLALNFGPNKDTPPDRVAEDYAALTPPARARSPTAIVVNLSSPNTPGLREFQAPERMRAIVEAMRTALSSTQPATSPDAANAIPTAAPRQPRCWSRSRPTSTPRN